MANTIEERANKYWQDKYPYLSGMYMRDTIKIVFTESAIEQKKIDIDKAIYWLQTQNLTRGRTGFINDFKNAMEE